MRNAKFIERWLRSSILAVLMCFILLLSGCDSTVKKDAIAVQALYGETVLELPIASRQHAYYAGLNNVGNYFKPLRNYSYPEILKIVEGYALERSGHVTALGDHTQAIITFNTNGTQDSFLVSLIGPNRYMISTMRVDIRFEGFAPGHEEKHLLFPIYLTNDKRLEKDYITQTLDEGVEYELAPDVSVDDFFSFYHSSGWFDAEIQDGSLVLNAFNGPENHPDTPHFTMNYPLVFCFETHVGITYFKIVSGA